MKKSLWMAGSVAALVGAAAFYYYRSDVAAEAPVLTTAEVSRGRIVATVDATGTLEAVTTVQVGSQVSGTISALRADFNSEVRKGQIVAELDSSLFQTQVEQARATVVRLNADVERARVQATDAALKFKRAQELSKQQLIPASDLETAESNKRAADAAVKSAEAQVVQAQASLNQADVNMSHTVIRAPIDGVVIARNVDVGQTVAASMQAPTLFIIARDLRAMQVNASIDESDIGEIQPKQPVTFRVDAYPNDVFRGTVSQVRLQPVVQQNVVSYVTVIDVPNPDLKLKPGMTAAVTVEIARADDVLKVPNAALRFRPSTDTATAGRGGGAAGRGEERQAAAVWVLVNGVPQRVPVKAGITDGRDTAILDGELTTDTRVVVGTTVTAVTTTAPVTSPLLPAGRRGGGGGPR